MILDSVSDPALVFDSVPVGVCWALLARLLFGSGRGEAVIWVWGGGKGSRVLAVRVSRSVRGASVWR